VDGLWQRRKLRQLQLHTDGTVVVTEQKPGGLDLTFSPKAIQAPLLRYFLVLEASYLCVARAGCAPPSTG